MFFLQSPASFLLVFSSGLSLPLFFFNFHIDLFFDFIWILFFGVLSTSATLAVSDLPLCLARVRPPFRLSSTRRSSFTQVRKRHRGAQVERTVLAVVAAF